MRGECVHGLLHQGRIWWPSARLTRIWSAAGTGDRRSVSENQTGSPRWPAQTAHLLGNTPSDWLMSWREKPMLKIWNSFPNSLIRKWIWNQGFPECSPAGIKAENKGWKEGGGINHCTGYLLEKTSGKENILFTKLKIRPIWAFYTLKLKTISNQQLKIWKVAFAVRSPPLWLWEHSYWTVWFYWLKT